MTAMVWFSMVDGQRLVGKKKGGIPMFEKTLKMHYERHCRGLTMEEVGAQLALSAAAESRPDGSRILTLDGEALALLLGVEEIGNALELLRSLKRKGRVKVAVMSPGVYELRMALFVDRWARDRQKKLRSISGGGFC